MSDTKAQTIQSEAILEKQLIDQLLAEGYTRAIIPDEDALLANFRIQFEKHNKVTLTDEEFNRLLIFMNGGNIFDKAKRLRDKYELKRDEGVLFLEFFNKKDWCLNSFQVANQITLKGKYTNRYDVTLLINGLPLVQIELKRRGIELKEAFNQTIRYHRHSFHGLFRYIQMFVISNGVNTRYYANNPSLNYEFTFTWSDAKNNRINDLKHFASVFLEKCHIGRMIAKYIVLHESNKCLMVLRPYQFYAVESLIVRALNTNQNGYIWHTTGSGKTLTSFKTSQILAEQPEIDKVIFVVDRCDLDHQTKDEFNAFCPGAVDGTDNTSALVKQLNDHKKLLITTIQKLNKAVTVDRFTHRIKELQGKKVILIFDECHRSQFGDMHTNITGFFKNIQSFGFTGTPILAENANNNRTTKDIFGECLHKYLIKDAIDDENVLGFYVDYMGKFKKRNPLDINVEDIDRKEVMDSPKRLSKIVDFIIANHNDKTYNRDFNAIFAVSSIQVLIKYYELFKQRDHSLKIATIFSYGANADSDFTDPLDAKPEEAVHAREKLDQFIKDYNAHFGTDYNTDTFDSYYIDVAKRVKKRDIDILLVVGMFLTGFDSKTLNTLYVDKNLKYHGLVQAFSRTNRIYDRRKRHGNIVCFRNLKEETDKALRLYSNAEALETVIMRPYDELAKEFNEKALKLLAFVEDPQKVDQLQGEDAKLQFVQLFRDLLRLNSRISTYSEFSFDDLAIDPQEFEDYKSKYLDIYSDISTARDEKEKTSILDDVDFELELIRRDKINVDYIIELLKSLDTKAKSYRKDKENIIDIMNATPELKSKVKLIEQFINEFVEQRHPMVPDSPITDEDISDFFSQKRAMELNALASVTSATPNEVVKYYEDFEYSGHFNDDILRSAFADKPGLIERRKRINHIKAQIKAIIQNFTWSA